MPNTQVLFMNKENIPIYQLLNQWINETAPTLYPGYLFYPDGLMEEKIFLPFSFQKHKKVSELRETSKSTCFAI